MSGVGLQVDAAQLPFSQPPPLGQALLQLPQCCASDAKATHFAPPQVSQPPLVPMLTIQSPTHRAATFLAYRAPQSTNPRTARSSCPSIARVECRSGSGRPLAPDCRGNRPRRRSPQDGFADAVLIGAAVTPGWLSLLSVLLEQLTAMRVRNGRTTIPTVGLSMRVGCVDSC
jgi:hypothetical protein